MEIKTLSRRLRTAAFIITMCLLVGLLFPAGGSAQMAIRAGDPFPRGDAGLFRATLVPQPDEYEPDNAQHKANPIAVNGPPQRHNFHKAYDEDWVKFRAWAGNEYIIRTFDLDFGCDTVLGLYDANGNKLLENDDDPTRPGTRASRIDFMATENGTYFVRVSQYDPSVGGNLWYSLEIAGNVICRDEFEPDDTWDHAKQIVPNGMPQDHNFHGPCGGDEDWVWFEAIGGNTYTIRTFDLEGGNDTMLELFQKTPDGNPVKVAENDDDPNNIPASRIDWMAPEDGIYLIGVTPFMSSAGGCDLSYRLSVATSIGTFTPLNSAPLSTSDPYEPDDAMYEANPISVNGAPQNHTFHAEEDEDWVKFWAWAGNSYTIRTFNLGSGNDTTLKLYDSDGHKLAENDDDPNNPPASRIDWTALNNGSYFVRVARPKVGNTGRYGLNSSGDLAYSLEVKESIPCKDEYEQDDSWAEAKWIVVGGPPQIHNFHVPCFNTYHPLDTADWVKFEATKGFTYTIKTSNLEGGNDTILGLYDPNGIRITVNDDDADNIPASKIVWCAPADGTYYVKVSPFDQHAGGCEVSYTLEVAPWITSVELTVSPTVVAADGVATSTLTACVEDYEGKPAEGVTVCFTTTLGELSDECKRTGPDGCASVTLTSTEPGAATVKACVGPICSPEAGVNFVKYLYLPLVLSSWPPNHPPYTPSSPSPLDGATVQSGEIELSWSGGDPDPGDAVTYDVYFGTSSPPPFKETIGPYPAAQTLITYNLSMLSDDTTYYWHIVARDSYEVESSGPEWDFTVNCPCNDTHEPDDDYSNCKKWSPLVSGEPFDSYICKDHIHLEDDQEVERDWYWFEVTTLDTITIELTVPDTVNYDLFLWGPGFSDWEKSDHPERGADEHIVCSPVSTGEYLVVVKSLGDYDDCNPYTLTATYR